MVHRINITNGRARISKGRFSNVGGRGLRATIKNSINPNLQRLKDSLAQLSSGKGRMKTPSKKKTKYIVF